MATKQRRGVNDAAKPRLNVRMSAESHTRLMIHCVMTGKQPGQFLDDLVNTHCRDWKVQANRSTSVMSDDRLDLSADVNSMALNAVA
jgi:hypothetical protein